MSYFDLSAKSGLRKADSHPRALGNPCGRPAFAHTYLSAARRCSSPTREGTGVGRLRYMAHYAVAWQTEHEPTQAGRLDVGRKGIRLVGGRHRAGRLSGRRLLYRDVLEAKMASTEKRLRHRPTIQVRSGNGSLYIAPLAAGLAREILHVLQLRVDLA
jgi:hypothetical protein